MIFKIFDKNLNFLYLDQNRDNFPKCWQKICWIFCQNQDFSKTLSNIKISKHFEQNRDFWKLWPEFIFSENFDQNQHFRKFGRKSRCSKMKMFSQKRDFSKTLTIIDILQNFCPISRLSTISTKIEIIENFDQNRDFQIFCPKPEIIAKNADKNKI